ncbi:MAG: prepilin peptidase, partial [Endomicrobiia bacterium]|nr:prepilin peptidase [Endomicrobiia bacterium]
RGLSVVSPRSFCPSCRAQISWRDNVPVLSWLFLRGRCRMCGLRVSPRYPLVETAVALLFGALYFKFGLSLGFAVFAPFVWMLVVVAAIDIEHRIIPDEFSLGAVVVGAALSFVNPFFLAFAVWHTRLLFSLVGASSGLALGFAVAWLGEKIFRKESLGGGDVKLLAASGAYMGAAGAVWTLLLASFVGSVVSLALIAAKKIGRSDYVPFGPFLAVGALMYIFLF